ncbi:MAG: hypothetical protein DRQ47_11130 [Gammaproteobacteria bacterium]|nr:MAG: hypothetical protein DRQ47_11130 [Gammaproteobacteria bacterium]
MVIDKLVKDTGRSPEQIRAKGSDLGKESSLVDATGDVGVAYGQGGRAKGTLESADTIERSYNKIEAAKDRVRSTMEMASGKRQGQFYRTKEDLIENRKANAETNYGKAFDSGVVMSTPRMAQLINENPLMRKAFDNARKAYEGKRQVMPEIFDVDSAGKFVSKKNRSANMRAIQRMKWEMDALIRSRRGSIDAKDKDDLRDLLRDRKQFLNEIPNKDFHNANRVYAGDSAMLDAQETGFKHGLGSKDVEAHLEYIRGLNKSEKDAYLQGVMSKVYGEMGSTPENVLGNMNKITSENARSVLNTLVGKDKAKKIFKRVASEKRYREVNTELRKGSQTELRNIAKEAFNKKSKSIPLEMLNMTPTGRIVHAIRQYDPSMSAQQADDVVKIITKEGGIDSALLRLEMLGMNPAKAEGLFSEVMRATSAVAPTMTDANPETDPR